MSNRKSQSKKKKTKRNNKKTWKPKIKTQRGFSLFSLTVFTAFIIITSFSHGLALLLCSSLRPTCCSSRITSTPKHPLFLQLCHPSFVKTAPSTCSCLTHFKLGRAAFTDLMAMGFSSFQTTTSHLRPCPSYFSLLRACPLSSRSLWTPSVSRFGSVFLACFSVQLCCFKDFVFLGFLIW